MEPEEEYVSDQEDPAAARQPEPVAWLRRCDGAPAAGVLTARAEAAAVPYLADTRDLRGNLAAGMTWRAAGRNFSLEPLTDAQLRTWCDTNGVVPPAWLNAGAETASNRRA